MYKFVKALDLKFVLGSLICARCRNKLQLKMRQESSECDEDDSDDNDPTFFGVYLDDKLEKREQLEEFK